MVLSIDWDKAFGYYSEGLSFNKVTLKLNCSRKCVEVNLKKRFNTRTLQESEKLNRGEKHHLWKTGIITKIRGHVMIRINGKYVRRSHYNWCIANQMLVIPKGCIIHHRDMDKTNDNPENLVLLPRIYHNQLHGAMS